MRACLAALLLFISGLATTAENHYETRAQHDPDGIGKFYLGREIARVMGAGGAAWLARPEREAEERPQLTLEALEIKPGQTVADLGAGVGYYTFRVSERVGKQGTVFAIDVEPVMLKYISTQARRDMVENVVTVLSTPAYPAHFRAEILGNTP